MSRYFKSIIPQNAFKFDKPKIQNPIIEKPILDKYYFAYGSNTNIAQMKIRCPNAVAHGVFTLFDHALVMRGVADIEEVEDARCHGVIWAISSACELSLDRAEGYPFLYEKKTVAVFSGRNKVEAIVYTMTEKSHTYRPCKAYYNRIKSGYQAFGINDIQLEDACDFSYRGLEGPYSNRKEYRIPHLHPEHYASQVQAFQLANQEKAWDIKNQQATGTSVQDNYEWYFHKDEQYTSY